MVSISFTQLKRLKVHQVKKLKSCVVTADGVYLFTLINPNTDYVKLSAENLANLSNSVGGEELEEVLIDKD